MQARVKPTELKTVISLLETEHPDVEDLAKDVILELKNRWLNEDYYVVLLYDPNAQWVYSYGPYQTENQAKKALGSLVSAGPIQSSGWISRLVDVPHAS